MKLWEIEEQKVKHPELHARALAMETNWLHGKHEKGSTQGLGRKFAWANVKAA